MKRMTTTGHVTDAEILSYMRAYMATGYTKNAMPAAKSACWCYASTATAPTVAYCLKVWRESA